MEEPDLGRLDQAGVSAYIKDVVTLLLENRPESPVDFISDYFRNAIKGSTGEQRSYRYIRLTNRHRETFMDNLLAAYTSLDSKLHESSGLTGVEYTKLLRLLCVDFPLEVIDTLFNVLGKGSNDAIDFRTFCSGVNACMIYEEFFEEVEWLFKGLADSNGTVDFGSFMEVIAQIKQTTQEENKQDQITYPNEKQIIASLALHGVKIDTDNRIAFKQFIAAIFQTTQMPSFAKVQEERKDNSSLVVDNGSEEQF